MFNLNPLAVLDIADAAANDSNKSFTFNGPVVPLWFHVILATSATVGNRTMIFEVLDNAGSPAVRFSEPMGPNVAAATTRYFDIQLYVPHEAAFGGPGSNHIHVPMPMLVLPEGWSIRIRDSAAVDAAADDLTIYGQIVKL